MVKKLLTFVFQTLSRISKTAIVMFSIKSIWFGVRRHHHILILLPPTPASWIKCKNLPNSTSRNARKPTKGSKNLDSSLVSNNNLIEILPSCGWSPGQVTWAKRGKTYPTYDVTHQKPETPNFFHCRLEDLPSILRISVNSSLVQSIVELWSCNVVR